MLRFLYFVGFALAMSTCMAHRTARPNVVFILGDDVGRGDIASYNPDSLIPTPNIDALAENGIQFTNAYAPTAVCAPSRYSYLTGKNNWRGRREIGTWNHWKHSQFVDGDRTIADYLSKVGYSCAVVGKWHLGCRMKHPSGTGFVDESPNPYPLLNQLNYETGLVGGPLAHGFDYSFILLDGIQNRPYAFIENDCLYGWKNDDLIYYPKNVSYDQMIALDIDAFEGPVIYQNDGMGAPDFLTDRVPHLLLDKALAFIRKSATADQPFFLYYAAVEAHSPWAPPVSVAGEAVRNTIEGPNYLEMVKALDLAVGEIVKTLKSTGELENTLIVFASDNGGLPYAFRGKHAVEHDSTYGLRESKTHIYEGGIAIPWLMSWPGHPKFTGGRMLSEMVFGQDLLPTLLSLLDLASLEASSEDLDGTSLLPLIELEAQTLDRHRPVIFQSLMPNRPRYAIREGHWKLIIEAESQKHRALELYNLSDDSKESENLLRSESEVAERLFSEFRKVWEPQIFERN